MKIKGAIGFRQVIDLLSSKKKLIVGHNSFLDVAHIYRKFIGHLPSNCQRFCSNCPEVFPVHDGYEVMLNTNSVLETLLKRSSRNTSLSKAFALLCPQIASVEKTLWADAVRIKWNTQSLGPVSDVATLEDEMVPNKNKVLPDSPHQTENVEEVLSNGNGYRDELDSFFPSEAAQLPSR
ncbi:OLC1v1027759C1 [Oldenlandia corymbosa var. corymbosa]|uniref:OLC1v1027759C1 n=1 Tax=Oldenlandia corymbosa var. corymbosa TaxID=529605 RepID=A0AAV1CA77_OLDCO|nr:OLC1v1027759C1 [Oldenlandia corymbosa var. corymbosa]